MFIDIAYLLLVHTYVRHLLILSAVTMTFRLLTNTSILSKIKVAPRIIGAKRLVHASAADDLEHQILDEFSQKYLGGRRVDFTDKLNFVSSIKQEAIPIYRTMRTNGEFVDTKFDSILSKDRAIDIYKKVKNKNNKKFPVTLIRRFILDVPYDCS